MSNREAIIKYLRDFRDRIDELLDLFSKKIINFDVLKLNLGEDISDLEDRIKNLFSKGDLS